MADRKGKEAADAQSDGGQGEATTTTTAQAMPGGGRVLTVKEAKAVRAQACADARRELAELAEAQAVGNRVVDGQRVLELLDLAERDEAWWDAEVAREERRVFLAGRFSLLPEAEREVREAKAALDAVTASAEIERRKLEAADANARRVLDAANRAKHDAHAAGDELRQNHLPSEVDDALKSIGATLRGLNTALVEARNERAIEEAERGLARAEADLANVVNLPGGQTIRNIPNAPEAVKHWQNELKARRPSKARRAYIEGMESRRDRLQAARDGLVAECCKALLDRSLIRKMADEVRRMASDAAPEIEAAHERVRREAAEAAELAARKRARNGDGNAGGADDGGE